MPIKIMPIKRLYLCGVVKEKKKQYLNDLNLGLTKFVPTTCTCN